MAHRHLSPITYRWQRGWLLAALLALLLVVAPLRAQDGLNLPTELYVLRNDGVVERYGLGASGVRSITPEGDFVLDFRVSPGGDWLAYRTQDGLYQRDIYGDAVRQLRGADADIPPVRGRGETLAWSPLADALAYTTADGGRVDFLDDAAPPQELGTPNLQHLSWSPGGGYLAAEANDGIWWIFRRQGTVLTLTSAIPGAEGLAWLSDTAIVFTPLDGGLVVMELVEANRQTRLLSANRAYRLPFVQDDGSILVFAMTQGDEGVLTQVTPTANGADAFEIGSGAVDLRGAAWSPDGGLLTRFQGGALALVDAPTGNGFVLPMSSIAAYGWGPLYADTVAGLRLPQDVTFSAPGVGGIRQVWRAPADGSAPAALTAADHDITGYALSPDETRLVYISNSTLWLAQLTGTDAPRELVALQIGAGVGPAWGPDGATLYYRDEAPEGSGIWRYTLDDDAATLFLADADGLIYTQPRPAPGVSALLVTARGDAGPGLVVVDAVSGEARNLGALRQGRWWDGPQVLAVGAAPAFGVQALNVNDEPPTPTTRLEVAVGTDIVDRVPLAEGGLRVLLRTGLQPLRVVQVTPGGVDSVVATIGYLSQARLAADGSMALGLTHPGGQLVAHTIANGERLRLAQPTGVRQARWQ